MTLSSDRKQQCQSRIGSQSTAPVLTGEAAAGQAI
jgi:hypothetical protein